MRAEGGERYAVAAGCREAAEAATGLLESGGNVVDAALAASAVLCVVLPNAVSIGGDLFALLRIGVGSEVVAINASGPAPIQATIAEYRRRGRIRIPVFGPLSVELPGLVAGWEVLHRGWGSRPLPEILDPAIQLARQGVRVGKRLAACIKEKAPHFATLPGWAATFLPDGCPLTEGAWLVQPALAQTLTRIAAQGASGFYAGPVAADLTNTVRRAGGLLTEADLASVRAEVLRPLRLRYRDYELFTQPPVSQGVVLLRAMKLLQMAIPDPRATSEAALWLRAAEALRQSFQERLALLGDMPEAAAWAMRLLTDPADLSEPRCSTFTANPGSDTTTLVVTTASGDTVAIILSVYGDLGAGVLAQESGVLLNNRLSGFFLDPGHPNCLRPGRRSMHTLHNFIAMDHAGISWAGGTPGGDSQPQINLQLLVRLIDLGMEPEAAVLAANWASKPGTDPDEIAEGAPVSVDCEKGVSDETVRHFLGAGWHVHRGDDVRLGSIQLVGRGKDPNTVCAWTDGRREGHALAA